MLLNFDDLYQKYELKINGVIHVGGHFGQEYKTYKKYGINNIIFFEPTPETFEVLIDNVGQDNALFVNKALGSKTGKVMMNIEDDNLGQSNSILNPKLHIQQYPHIKFNNQIEVDLSTLDIELQDKNKYNFINMDVQGYELEVLKGSTKTLENIDYIMTEVNRAEVYENCAKIEELDGFLIKYNFKRVETYWATNSWGDAFYIKYE